MLDQLVTEYIVWKNLRKIAPRGALGHGFATKPKFISIDGRKSYGYQLYFFFDDNGLIQPYSSHNPKGYFSVAVDEEPLEMNSEMENENEIVRTERILNYKISKPLPDSYKEKVHERLQATLQRFNHLFGFNPDYNGFTAGDFLNDIPLF